TDGPDRLFEGFHLFRITELLERGNQVGLMFRKEMTGFLHGRRIEGDEDDMLRVELALAGRQDPLDRRDDRGAGLDLNEEELSRREFIDDVGKARDPFSLVGGSFPGARIKCRQLLPRALLDD